MTRIVRCMVLALTVLAMAAVPVNGPIGLDWHIGGHLYVLLKDGSVSILDEISRRKLATIPPVFGMAPVEIFSARLNEREYVFVSGFAGRAGSIYQYTAEGKLYAKFDTPEQAAGFDIDPERHLLYIASPVTSFVYAINIDQKGSVAKRVAYIREAQAAGPLVFDRGRNRVMLGDTGRGVLYDVDVTTGKYQEIVSDLQRPISMAIGGSFRRLFVADSVTGRIHIFRVDNGEFKHAEDIETGLKGLAAVTFGPEETLIVADGHDNWQLSLKTKKLSRFPY
jgi:hypothetical protein